MSGRFKRIMVPLDGSRLAESVLPLAVGLAQCLDATVELLHIIEESPPPTVHGEPHLTGAAQAEEYMAKVAETYKGGVKIETHVHSRGEHNVSTAIAAHVDELGADMVALCTHGGNDLRRVVWGSIAQQVLRKIGTPILLVRPSAHPPSSLNGLLVPLDCLPDTEPALDVAAELAQSCGVPARLITVVPTAMTVTGDRLAAARLTPLSTAAALDAEMAQSKDYLEAAVKRLRGEGVDASGEVRRGDIVTMLMHAAERNEGGLMVLATHGRLGLDAIWTGSVVPGLIYRVALPVLMLRI